MATFPVTVTGERHFLPFHMLIAAALENLEELRKYQLGGTGFAISTMVLSALAVEALANSFGFHKIERWKDFESSSPVAKIRLICKELNIPFDHDKSPFREILELLKFRNVVAHAKPSKVNIDKTIDKENLHELFDLAPAKLEQAVSHLEAEKAFKAITELKDLFYSKLDHEKDSHIFHSY